MPFKYGNKAAVLLDQYDMSTLLQSAGVSIDVDSADTTTFGATWKTAIAGTASAKLDFDGLYDPTSTNLLSLLAVDPGAVLTYCPAGGTVIGDVARMSSVMLSTYSESSPVGGVVAVKWSAMGSGVLGLGSITHPLAIDTGTTTGAAKDEGAATTTGWTAHLHVTAVSSGSWVVTIQDSADGTTGWTLVTGATFTAKTVAGSQRLTGAAGATVRRWIRYVATVTGGSTPTITFALAVARN